MSKNFFKPTIKTVTQKNLFGNWMTLGAETMKRDYDLAWKLMSIRLKPIASLVRGRFGLCKEEVRLGRSFPYWTAVELRPGAPIPAGMAQILLPSGLYLALDQGPGVNLDELYDFVYNSWENSQNEFIVNRSRFCLEQYGATSRSPEKMTLLMPLASRIDIAMTEADEDVRPIFAEAGPGGRLTLPVL